MALPAVIVCCWGAGASGAGALGPPGLPGGDSEGRGGAPLLSAAAGVAAISAMLASMFCSFASMRSCNQGSLPYSAPADSSWSDAVVMAAACSVQSRAGLRLPIEMEHWPACIW